MRPGRFFVLALLAACGGPAAAPGAQGPSRPSDAPAPVPLFERIGSRATIDVEGQTVEFGSEGTQLDASLALRTAGWGRDGASRTIGTVELGLESGWLTVRNPGLLERWRPLQRGLEQAWRARVRRRERGRL